MKKNNFLLEPVVFLCGAIVMVFELVGSRVLGPYFGTSIFVWTSIIGIIFGSLSLGYYLGGKIADKKPSFVSLSFIIFLSAIFVGIMALIKEPFLIYVSGALKDAKIASVLAAVILFAPTSILLGMVSPYAVKLKVSNLNTTGATVGRLSSISTAGSIFGTFLAGFYLIPTFGTNILLFIMSVMLFLISFSLTLKKTAVIRFSVMILFVFGFVFIDTGVAGRIDVDTAYNRVWIYDYAYGNTGRMVKKMGINNENHSSMFLDSDELVNEYTKYYHLVSFFNPNFKKALMIGGAAYSYPKDFLNKYKEATLDVVEIDPKMTELAKTYFRLKEDPRLSIFHEDGRVFLNTTKNKYDVIFGDAFTSRYSVPYQLTTKEAVQKNFDILNDDGVVILNIISAIDGVKGQFLRAEYATYKSIFPQVFLFPVRTNKDGNSVQNIILVALKGESKPDFTKAPNDLVGYLSHLWKFKVAEDMPFLTDDFAPVDYYMNKAV